MKPRIPRPGPRRKNLLPRFMDTMREVVEDFEVANHLVRTGSGADVRPTQWHEIEKD
jgi:hypothetical protein